MSESRGGDAAGNDVLAIDVGSSRVKLARFVATGDCTSERPASALPIAVPRLPEPIESLSLAHGHQLSDASLSRLGEWLEDNFAVEPRSFMASVRPTVAAELAEFFERRGWKVPRQLGCEDLALKVRVEAPHRVGIDRLLNAVAANELREPEQPAILVDLGTAGTIDLVAADGAFEGGAILPGMKLWAQALHSGTSSLPETNVAALDEATAIVGKNTETAIAAGLYWGTIGAVNGLINRVAESCAATPQLFVTGGAAVHVVKHLGTSELPARHVPHMVTAAIRLVGEQLS